MDYLSVRRSALRTLLPITIEQQRVKQKKEMKKDKGPRQARKPRQNNKWTWRVKWRREELRKQREGERNGGTRKNKN